jgi:hypothetical protein
MYIKYNCLNCNLEVERSYKGTKPKFCSSACREKKWSKDNREKHNASVRRYRAKRYAEDGFWRDSGPKAIELKNWMKELKSNPCLDCGGIFPICCMDFDHREGTQKSYNIGSMFAHHYSKHLIEKELEKCDLVCSNCHRIRTQKRRIGKKLAKKSSIP